MLFLRFSFIFYKHVCLYKIGSNLDKFPQDKTIAVYLYCKSGPMGNAAARSLLKNGYEDVFNLLGGIESWIEAGYPLEKE